MHSVIAVHGLGRDEKPTWDPLNPFVYGYVEWFRDCVTTSRVSIYHYCPLDDNSNIFGREGIRFEALRLLSAIRQLPLKGEKRSRLVFIGHDIGAIIIKEVSINFYMFLDALNDILQALIQAAFGDAKLKDIYWSTHAIVRMPAHFEDYLQLPRSYSEDLNLAKPDALDFLRVSSRCVVFR